MATLRSVLSFRAALVVLVAALVAPLARGATRAEIRELAVGVAERAAQVRPMAGRAWEDVPELVALVQLARDLDGSDPAHAARFRGRVRAAIGDGDEGITHGDYAGYAQAAFDLAASLASDDPDRARLLRATRGPLAFAERALRRLPGEDVPPAVWWVEGGYGTRFWEDDLFTIVPSLALASANDEGQPGDSASGDLAWEWIEAYLFDHRGASAGVPSAPVRRGAFLWDPAVGLFHHDPSVLGGGEFWGRGNGWAAYGLVRAQALLQPYRGTRYERIASRASLRAVLTRFAAGLASARADDGLWTSDLRDRERFPQRETSASSLLVFFLARGVNEGWLDETVYAPVLARAFGALRVRVDGEGDVCGVQPAGTGPDGALACSDDEGTNARFGAGTFLLAAAEVARLPESVLARFAEDAARPVERPVLGWTWTLETSGGVTAVRLANSSGGEVVVRGEERGPSGASPVSSFELVIPSSGEVIRNIGTATATVVLRASGVLDVSGLVPGRRPVGATRLDQGPSRP